MSRSLVSPVLLLGLVAAGCGGSAQGSPSSAATVNGHPISMAAYHTQVSYMVAQNLTSLQFNPCTVKSTATICTKLKQTALQNLIYEELVREYAAAHHISVSPADFNTQWTIVFQNRFQGNEPVLRAYAKSIHITVADLKDMVRQDILQQRVMYRVTQYMPLTAPAVHLAKISVSSTSELQSVRRSLKTGESFVHIARRLSLNLNGLCHQNGCGEVGWFPLALLPAQDRRITQGAPVGAVVGPVTSQQGFTLFLVEGHQAHLPLDSSQQLALRQQLFARWLAQRAKLASIRRYAST